MPMTNNPLHRYRCADCLHKHYWTPGQTFTLKDGKRVVATVTNFGSWGLCEDETCTCVGLHRLTPNQLELLLNKAEEVLGRPIGHRPPGATVEPQRESPEPASTGDGVIGADLPPAAI